MHSSQLVKLDRQEDVFGVFVNLLEQLVLLVSLDHVFGLVQPFFDFGLVGFGDVSVVSEGLEAGDVLLYLGSNLSPVSEVLLCLLFGDTVHEVLILELRLRIVDLIFF